MSRYAENTSVSVEKSRAEIEKILQRYGADRFQYGWDQKQAAITFTAEERMVRFVLPLPGRNSEEFTTTPTGRERSESQAYTAWEQACRQRWRALALAIKAKLEAVECEIATFEEEFMAHIVLPNNQTVSQWMGPQIEQAYQSKKMPRLLIGGISDE